MNIYEILTLFVIMFGLALLPSSSVALVLARSATAGVSHGILVSIGILLGDLFFVSMAMFSLSAMAQLMTGFFTALKVAGGIYLIWFGISLLRTKSEKHIEKEEEARKDHDKSLLVSLLSGFFLTLGDVKALIFYASLLPLFINMHSAASEDYAILFTITILSVGSAKMLYAFSATKVMGYLEARQISNKPKKIMGSFMIGVGGYNVFN